ncbi:MAG: hypothetical protein WBL27_12195 [Salinimicrobium sp.]
MDLVVFNKKIQFRGFENLAGLKQKTTAFTVVFGGEYRPDASGEPMTFML